MMKIIIALGGNAMILPKERGSKEEQVKHIRYTAKRLESLVDRNKCVITHGNGPQVGNLMIQQEATGEVPKMPLDVLVAETQGELGYMLQQEFDNAFDKDVITIVTQVVVMTSDAAFQNPTKPVGPFFKEPKSGYKEDAGRGYRKVVSSPMPLEVLEAEQINSLISDNACVIACGGGGIPVVQIAPGKHEGVEAVIDKDLASQVLGNQIGADLLIILTTVPYAYLNFGKTNQKQIEKMTIDEAKKYLEKGEFAEGSMAPKIRASIRFLENGGRKVIITDIDTLDPALKLEAGTIIE